VGIEWGRDNAMALPIEADPKTDCRVPVLNALFD
jgi:hypothetical protein